MNKAERLSDLLGAYASAIEFYNPARIKETRDKIIGFFTECVHEKATISNLDSDDEVFIKQVRNACRAETLRNIEELRK